MASVARGRNAWLTARILGFVIGKALEVTNELLQRGQLIAMGWGRALNVLDQTPAFSIERIQFFEDSLLIKMENDDLPFDNFWCKERDGLRPFGDVVPFLVAKGRYI